MESLYMSMFLLRISESMRAHYLEYLKEERFQVEVSSSRHGDNAKAILFFAKKSILRRESSTDSRLKMN